MELKTTLLAISDDARGWLTVWARDVAQLFTVEASPEPFVPASLEAALHENYHVGEIAALRKELGKARIG